jgi:hypothetical protein
VAGGEQANQTNQHLCSTRGFPLSCQACFGCHSHPSLWSKLDRHMLNACSAVSGCA